MTDLATNEQAGERAFDLEADVLSRLAGVRAQWVPLAASLFQFHSEKAWTARGCQSFKEWLAQPEIGLAYRSAKDLIDVFDEFAVKRAVTIQALAQIDASKLAVVLPALKRGDVTREDALADCRTLARSDLREKYQRPQGRLDATTEPVRCTCARCGHSHRPKDTE